SAAPREKRPLMSILFLSRNLTIASALATWAKERELKIIAQSLLEFNSVSFVAPAADWWFFYSSRAVEFSVEALRKLKRKPKLAAMGSGTARTLSEAGFKADFCGAGQPAEVAVAFGKLAQDQRVFFPRARQSRQTVQRLLAEKIRVEDAVCYDNVAVPTIAPIVADYYCFTSPLNVAAYVDHQALTAGAKIVAIGPSTAAALAQRNVAHDVLPEPTEAALIAWLARASG
ncbi:MAG: uroporphyrinogen-III synthase, partial [Bacteroidota bacterium]